MAKQDKQITRAERGYENGVRKAHVTAPSGASGSPADGKQIVSDYMKQFDPKGSTQRF